MDGLLTPDLGNFAAKRINTGLRPGHVLLGAGIGCSGLTLLDFLQAPLFLTQLFLQDRQSVCIT
jgi:hypothetical protein